MVGSSGPGGPGIPDPRRVSIDDRLLVASVVSSSTAFVMTARDAFRQWSWFRRPWRLEIIVLFAVLWQEALRLEWRTAHRVLPLSPRLTALYYYQAGDFVNGYLNAFLIDGVTAVVRQSRAGRASLTRAAFVRQALVASGLSIASIVVIELGQSALNHPDVADIPAGVVGALLYLLVRVAALRAARPDA